MARLTQAEYEAGVEHAKRRNGQGDGQGAKQQPVQGRGKCRAEGCRMLANEAGYCPTHYRQSMTTAVREASARRAQP